jgi:hypothetical protein
MAEWIAVRPSATKAWTCGIKMPRNPEPENGTSSSARHQSAQFAPTKMLGCHDMIGRNETPKRVPKRVEKQEIIADGPITTDQMMHRGSKEGVQHKVL